MNEKLIVTFYLDGPERRAWLREEALRSMASVQRLLGVAREAVDEAFAPRSHRSSAAGEERHRHDEGEDGQDGRRGPQHIGVPRTSARLPRALPPPHLSASCTYDGTTFLAIYFDNFVNECYRDRFSRFCGRNRKEKKKVDVRILVATFLFMYFFVDVGETQVIVMRG